MNHGILRSMTTENQPQPTAPDAWYIQVNRLLGWCWGIMLPVALGILLRWPDWVTIIVTIVWYLLNIRVMDRYIPMLGNPLVDMVYRLFHWRRSEP